MIEVLLVSVSVVVLGVLAFIAHKAHLETKIKLELANIAHKEKDYVNTEYAALINRIKELEAGAERFVASINATNTSIASTQQMLNAIGINRNVQR